jgi:hypothetical protein
MIPKIIHYCWFGRKPLPRLALMCIESWKKYFPDYEIKEWNEDNYNVHIIPYTHEAYERKKYAFVSDFARFDILYQEGGIYFDTDVEVISNMEAIVARGAFMACEQDYNSIDGISVAPGLGLAAMKGMPLFAEIIEMYKNIHFIKQDGACNLKTVVQYTTELLKVYGLQNIPGIQVVKGITIYPTDYMCPVSVVDGKLRLTKDTVTIHHYAQSWQSPLRKYMRKSILFIGGSWLKNIIKLCVKRLNIICGK